MKEGMSVTQQEKIIKTKLGLLELAKLAHDVPAPRRPAQKQSELATPPSPSEVV